MHTVNTLNYKSRLDLTVCVCKRISYINQECVCKEHVVLQSCNGACSKINKQINK